MRHRTLAGRNLPVERLNNFLLPRLLPNSIRIDAHVTDRAAAVMRHVPETARLFAFHIDCTNTARFPLERDELTRRLRESGTRVLNEGVTDIEAPLEQMCASLGLPTVSATEQGPADELLIVKTDLNSAGLPESRLGFWDRERLRVLSRKIIADGKIITLARSDIPAHWWKDDTLVIESTSRTGGMSGFASTPGSIESSYSKASAALRYGACTAPKRSAAAITSRAT